MPHTGFVPHRDGACPVAWVRAEKSRLSRSIPGWSAPGFVYKSYFAMGGGVWVGI